MAVRVACMRQIISSPRITPPVGPYSHAVAASGELVFVSGQTGQDPGTGEIVTGGVDAETRQVLANLSQVLGAAGLDLASVVKCNVFLVDMADFNAMNTVFAEVVPGPFPARSTVAVAALPLGARVEIECVALR
jgi:2-iminobutanoate/2-iminopropanoate deaminase